MSLRRKIAPELRDAVRERAQRLCEYCHACEIWQYVEFTIDHVLPLATGGETVMGNLALVCFACNRRKWDRRVGFDPETGSESRLFNPRTDVWNDHFVWSEHGLEVHGTSLVGRATVGALDMNRERLLLVRAADVHVGRHPPAGDRRLP